MTELYHPFGQNFVTWSYDLSQLCVIVNRLRLPVVIQPFQGYGGVMIDGNMLPLF